MNPGEVLLTNIETAFAREYEPTQRAMFAEKLNALPWQILAKTEAQVLKRCKRLPMLAEFFECAREAGWREGNAVDGAKHEWTASDCKGCGGTGLVALMWTESFEHQGAESFQYLELKRVRPYVVSLAEEFEGQTDWDVRTLHRCGECPAGSAPGVPRYPEFSRNSQRSIRRKWKRA
jgi:hypothetical protein